MSTGVEKSIALEEYLTQYKTPDCYFLLADG